MMSVPRARFSSPSRITFLAAMLISLLATSPVPVVHAQDSSGEDPTTSASVSGDARTPIPAGQFYGLNFVQPNEPWMALARASGADVVRWQFNWRDIEPSRGSYTWAVTDAEVTSWNNGGMRIHAILHNPPDWAKANSSGLVPTNFRGAWNESNNAWGQFCHSFAERYRGRIDSYEIWNEPDLNQYWEGTAEEYFYLMRSCYMGIRAADSVTPIAMAGMALLVERNFFPTVVRLAAEDPQGPANNYFFDAANIHMYADPDLVYSLTIYTQRILNTYGLGYKPIWITETNIALAGYGNFQTHDWGHASEEEQGWFVLQAAANAYAAGAQRLMFFRLADDNMDQAFGIVSNDGRTRPSYQSLQLASSILYDIVEARREVRQGVILTYLLRADGSRIIVAFSKTGSSLNIAVEARQAAAIQISATGGTSTIQAQNGVYTLALPVARNRDFSNLGNYSVGGPVVIVLEKDDTPPSARAAIQPVPGDSGRVLVQWLGDDGEFGTGIAAYEVQVSINDGPWQEWQAGIPESQSTYDISEGGSYSFRVRAMDKAGNLGEYSEPVSTSLVPVGTLVMEIRDLRDQLVPFARVTLSDGTLHDADAEGVATITTAPGLVRVANINGSAQGQLQPGEPFEISLAEQSLTTWLLLPTRNLIPNSQFEFGSQGWRWSSPGDVSAIGVEGDQAVQGDALQLSGGRRAWGSPGAETTVDVPEDWSGALLSFWYHIPQRGTTLRVRIITRDGQTTIWRAESAQDSFRRVWLDLSQYQGQSITLRFELGNGKTDSDGLAQIDDVIIGNVPLIP